MTKALQVVTTLTLVAVITAAIMAAPDSYTGAVAVLIILVILNLCDLFSEFE